MWAYIARQVEYFKGWKGGVEAIGPELTYDEADNAPVIVLKMAMPDLGNLLKGECSEAISFKIGPLGTVAISSTFTELAAQYASTPEPYSRLFVTAADTIRYFQSPEGAFTGENHFGGRSNDPFQLTQCSIIAQHLACVRRS